MGRAVEASPPSVLSGLDNEAVTPMNQAPVTGGSGGSRGGADDRRRRRGPLVRHYGQNRRQQLTRWNNVLSLQRRHPSTNLPIITQTPQDHRQMAWQGDGANRRHRNCRCGNSEREDGRRGAVRRTDKGMTGGAAASLFTNHLQRRAMRARTVFAERVAGTGIAISANETQNSSSPRPFNPSSLDFHEKARSDRQ